MKPILLKGEMVRAVLEGRKTQTRCPIVPQPKHADYWTIHYDGNFYPNKLGAEPPFLNCPWQIGDRLWVRETWLEISPPDMRARGIRKAWYKADVDIDTSTNFTWRPSIHMPRWASRITLEITDIRVERIQDITDDDCEREGIKPNDKWLQFAYRKSFMDLWNSIYAKKGYGWDTNCWVFVGEFKGVK